MSEEQKCCANCKHLRTEGHDVFTNHYCALEEAAYGFDGLKCYWWEHDDSDDQAVIEE